MTSRYRIRTILWFLLAVACLSGCATVTSLPQVGGSPIRSDDSTRNYTNSRIYQYPYQRVFASTRIVLSAWNFTIERGEPCRPRNSRLRADSGFQQRSCNRCLFYGNWPCKNIGGDYGKTQNRNPNCHKMAFVDHSGWYRKAAEVGGRRQTIEGPTRPSTRTATTLRFVSAGYGRRYV